MKRLIFTLLMTFCIAQCETITQDDMDYFVAQILTEKKNCADKITDESICKSIFVALEEAYKCYKTTANCQNAKRLNFEAKYHLDSISYVPEEEDGWYDPHFKFMEDVLNLGLIFIAKKEQRNTQRFFVRINWTLPKNDDNTTERTMMVLLLSDYVNSGEFGYICTHKAEIAKNPHRFSQKFKDMVDKYAARCK